MQFPTETIERSVNHKIQVMASFHKWAASRGLSKDNTPEWLAIDWYIYEHANFTAGLDYDSLRTLHSSKEFISSNATLEGDVA